VADVTFLRSCFFVTSQDLLSCFLAFLFLSPLEGSSKLAMVLEREKMELLHLGFCWGSCLGDFFLTDALAALCCATSGLGDFLREIAAVWGPSVGPCCRGPIGADRWGPCGCRGDIGPVWGGCGWFREAFEVLEQVCDLKFFWPANSDGTKFYMLFNNVWKNQSVWNSLNLLFLTINIKVKVAFNRYTKW